VSDAESAPAPLASRRRETTFTVRQRTARSPHGLSERLSEALSALSGPGCAFIPNLKSPDDLGTWGRPSEGAPPQVGHGGARCSVVASLARRPRPVALWANGAAMGVKREMGPRPPAGPKLALVGLVALLPPAADEADASRLPQAANPGIAAGTACADPRSLPMVGKTALPWLGLASASWWLPAWRRRSAVPRHSPTDGRFCGPIG
jgi:hypothetical protein